MANAKLSTFLHTDLVCKPWRVIILCKLKLRKRLEYSLALVINLMIPLRLSAPDIRHYRNCDIWCPVAAIGKNFLLMDLLILFEPPRMVLAVQEFFNRLTVHIFVICLPVWYYFLLKTFVISCTNLPGQAGMCRPSPSLFLATMPSYQVLQYCMPRYCCYLL